MSNRTTKGSWTNNNFKNNNFSNVKNLWTEYRWLIARRKEDALIRGWLVLRRLFVEPRRLVSLNCRRQAPGELRFTARIHASTATTSPWIWKPRANTFSVENFPPPHSCLQELAGRGQEGTTFLLTFFFTEFRPIIVETFWSINQEVVIKVTRF